MDKFIGTEFRSRYVNPTWIEGMKKEGYAGAGEMRQFVEYLWGWDATAPEVDRRREVEGDVRRLRRGQAQARHAGVLREELALRLSGHDRADGRDGPQGLLEGDAATQKKLLRSTSTASTSTAPAAPRSRPEIRGCRSTCSTRPSVGIPVPALDGFQKAMEQAMGGTVANTARATEHFVRNNEAVHRCARGPAIPGLAGAPQRTGARARCRGFQAAGLSDGGERSVPAVIDGETTGGRGQARMGGGRRDGARARVPRRLALAAQTIRRGKSVKCRDWGLGILRGLGIGGENPPRGMSNPQPLIPDP